MVRPTIPVYLCVVQPRMLQLAGEIGDGVLTWLSTPTYVEEVILEPRRWGRTGWEDPKEVDVASLILCSVSEDREEAMRRARINVGSYICFPRPIQWSGTRASSRARRPDQGLP